MQTMLKKKKKVSVLHKYTSWILFDPEYALKRTCPKYGPGPNLGLYSRFVCVVQLWWTKRQLMHKSLPASTQPLHHRYYCLAPSWHTWILGPCGSSGPQRHGLQAHPGGHALAPVIHCPTALWVSLVCEYNRKHPPAESKGSPWANSYFIININSSFGLIYVSTK